MTTEEIKKINRIQTRIRIGQKIQEAARAKKMKIVPAYVHVIWPESRLKKFEYGAIRKEA